MPNQNIQDIQKIKNKIETILYDKLVNVYCNNCRYNNEIAIDDERWSCDDCHRKNIEWGISKEKAKEISEEIINNI